MVSTVGFGNYISCSTFVLLLFMVVLILYMVEHAFYICLDIIYGYMDFTVLFL
jgi:hypothetical protein